MASNRVFEYLGTVRLIDQRSLMALRAGAGACYEKAQPDFEGSATRDANRRTAYAGFRIHITACHVQVLSETV
jgi:hypothetical protein